MIQAKFYTIDNPTTEAFIKKGFLKEDSEGAFNGTIFKDKLKYDLRAHWSNQFNIGVWDEFGKYLGDKKSDDFIASIDLNNYSDGYGGD